MPLDREVEKAVIKLKNWWKSFTIQLQGVMVLLAAGWDALPIVGGYLPADNWVVRGIIAVVAAATIWTRVFRTNQAVTQSAAEKPVATDKVIQP